ARRGGVPQYVTQLKLLVGEGLEQLKRDEDYVLNGHPSRFYKSANGRCLLEIDGRLVRRCYKILPTFDGLANIGTRLGRLEDLGILSSQVDAWIVSMTSFNLVIDILKRP